jgi:hypothetical protein
MRITLYDYVSDPSLPQKDGVNLAHENIASLLRSKDASQLTVEFHDFTRLLVDDSYARSILETTDCVVSNVGPHAHYYFYLRERLALDFRIVRDVRTALWSPYLLQEYLCAPYLREQDVLLAASHYAREIVEHIFPHQRQFRTIRCYPLSVAFPPERPQRIDQVGHPLTLGYIGRLSEDKNFPEIVELLIELNRREPGKYRLLACGDVHSRICHPVEVRRHIESKLGPGDYFEYMPPCRNGDIWEVYRQIDIMAFPSTSNLETLGRVLVEASYAGVPVVCGTHAAAPELMPWQALCHVEYTSHQLFNTHQDHSLGCLRIKDMADAIGSPDLKASECYRDYLTHPARFLGLLAGEEDQDLSGHGGLIMQSRVPRSFIQSLDIEMPVPLDSESADALIATLVPWVVTLQKKGSEERQRSLDILLSISRYPERTRRYIEKTRRTQCDFTDVGGIDMELCHVAGFYPHFTIRCPSQVKAAGLAAPSGLVT